MANSTMRRSAATLPDGFPLWKHPSGRWCKKVRGRSCYFGKVADDPDGQAALAKWLDAKDDLLAGRKPRTRGGGLTVRELANCHMTHKQRQLDAGEIVQGTYRYNYRACERLVRVFGPNRAVADLRPDDFELLAADIAKTLNSPGTRKLETTVTRSVFKFAYDSDLIDKPVRFGRSFDAPARRIIDKARRAKGAKTFGRDEVLALLADANPRLKAMILLGVNCGFGQADCATLPRNALDLAGGWLTHPRAKTGTARRAKLWVETVAALEAVLALPRNPQRAEYAALVFLSADGRPIVRGSLDTVRPAFVAMLKRLNLQRPGRGLYGLRHTFETVAGGSKDQVAVNLVMGHTDSSMAANYRHGIEDSRLVAVAEHVHAWLWPAEEGGNDE